MAKDTFNPDNKTISEIFSVDGIYKIPNYQRQYSWNDDQLDALWNDLYEAYQNKNENNDCYFLGSIVVVDDKKGYYELIDGQQRITTLMILMNVLVKDFSYVNENSDEIFSADKGKIENCILFQGKRNRLQLQTDPKYDSLFKDVIINCESFKDIDYPSKKDLKLDDPGYKYINTAVFFYNQLSGLSRENLDNFVNYIFYSTNIIRIECTNQSFAIKLFQVLNDRGLELSSADIIKSYIIGKYEADDENGKSVFNNNWKNIEELSKQYGFRIDDFIVYYEYYRIKSNPKRQVVDELRDIIQKSDVEELVGDLEKFRLSLKKVYESNNPAILGLRYIPWKFYVLTALTSAFKVEYPDKEKLFNEIRRFFYIAFIAGSTLNQIKQSSFNLIESIIEKKDIADIREDLNKILISKRMFAKMYDALDNDVYNEKFLKPLMLSLEYEYREGNNSNFYTIDNKLHMDHILPRAFKSNSDWDYIKEEQVIDKINTLGNMALLQDIKNEEALNFGFKKKIRIYKGLDEDGNIKSGYTSFDLTGVIIQQFDKDKIDWNINHINNRKEYLMNLIEKMLMVSRNDVELKIVEEDNGQNGKSKWLYKGNYYDNAKLVRALIVDYINQSNIKTIDDIPSEIRNFKMYSHELIVTEGQPLLDGYSYREVETNNMKLFIRSICQKGDTNDFIEILKKYYSFELKKIIEVEEN